MDNKEDDNKPVHDVGDSDMVNLGTELATLDQVRPKTKEEFFKFLGVPIGNYDLEITHEQSKRFKNSLVSLKTGLHSRVPMICPGGVKCPVGRRCDFTLFVLDKNGKQIRGPGGEPVIDTVKSRWPILQPCPYETSLIAMRIQDLCLEYNVDPMDPGSVTDMATISKLAELDIYDARASMALAQEAIVYDEVTGYEMGGDAREISSKRIHPAFEIKEKIHRMRNDLIKSMVGDRQSKVKAHATLTGAQEKATLTDVMTSLKRRLEEKTHQPDIIDVDVVVVDE